jgi:hypothetical protein
MDSWEESRIYDAIVSRDRVIKDLRAYIDELEGALRKARRVFVALADDAWSEDPGRAIDRIDAVLCTRIKGEE